MTGSKTPWPPGTATATFGQEAAAALAVLLDDELDEPSDFDEDEDEDVEEEEDVVVDEPSDFDGVDESEDGAEPFGFSPLPERESVR